MFRSWQDFSSNRVEEPNFSSDDDRQDGSDERENPDLFSGHRFVRALPAEASARGHCLSAPRPRFIGRPPFGPFPCGL